MEDFDDGSMDTEEVSVDTDSADFDEMPEEPNDSSADVNDASDESEMSISELYEQGQRDMHDAQQEEEDWADAHDVNAWSDGSMREGHENNEYYRSSLDADQMEQDGLEQQEEYNKKH